MFTYCKLQTSHCWLNTIWSQSFDYLRKRAKIISHSDLSLDYHSYSTSKLYQFSNQKWVNDPEKANVIFFTDFNYRFFCIYCNYFFFIIITNSSYDIRPSPSISASRIISLFWVSDKNSAPWTTDSNFDQFFVIVLCSFSTFIWPLPTKLVHYFSDGRLFLGADPNSTHSFNIFLHVFLLNHLAG